MGHIFDVCCTCSWCNSESSLSHYMHSFYITWIAHEWPYIWVETVCVTVREGYTTGSTMQTTYIWHLEIASNSLEICQSIDGDAAAINSREWPIEDRCDGHTVRTLQEFIPQPVCTGSYELVLKASRGFNHVRDDRVEYSVFFHIQLGYIELYNNAYSKKRHPGFQ